MTQIVITAPTPSSDSADKTFPPEPAPDDSQMSVAAAILERRKSAGEINEAEPPLYDTSLNECVDYPTTILEEPEEEEEEEEKYAEECKNGKSEGIETGSFPPTSVPATYQTNCVPEQLDTHQLQRLQQLKESNA